LLDLHQQINFQVFVERVWLLDVRWASGKDNIFQLDAVLWHAINKVEMEVTKEVREVLADHANYSQSSMIECLNSWSYSNSRNHIILKECEDANNKLFDLTSLFEIVTICYSLAFN
jgi:hypothetical protein